ncbi:hypothetical protein ABL78_0579 [Leptomonas seymouri]|uniref:Uncharacterized protein n=1 Tax=Leptomonas seymouri TaxID=5684 RepID=A0A0N1I1X3_LEPSE|nr:hypothetical protein ABL78_0579 [Leptomonas seymouri]|eukprot:KPI90352.1 hypothetical protein ABL78_0579 [Leptomonas seymouri]
MRTAAGSINRELLHSLYRKTLKLIATVEEPHAQRIVQTRWAEFVPPRVYITQEDSLRDVVRRSFESSYSAASVTNAFTFLKEGRESLFSVWVLVEWERLGAREQWDLSDALVLMSAALYGARVGCDTQKALESCMKDYQLCMHAYVQNLAEAVWEEINKQGFDAESVEGLTKVVNAVRDRSMLQQRSATPEDFSLISLLQRSCASEYVLNVVLLLVLRVLEVGGTLVGGDLAYRWVRVRPRNKSSPLFASWSYGAMRRADVERHICTSDKQWHRPAQGDSLQQRSVACALLQRQLRCLPNSSDPATQRIKSTCTEQILLLLS